jgi:hypothetical protein
MHHFSTRHPRTGFSELFCSARFASQRRVLRLPPASRSASARLRGAPVAFFGAGFLSELVLSRWGAGGRLSADFCGHVKCQNSQLFSAQGRCAVFTSRTHNGKKRAVAPVSKLDRCGSFLSAVPGSRAPPTSQRLTFFSSRFVRVEWHFPILFAIRGSNGTSQFGSGPAKLSGTDF